MAISVQCVSQNSDNKELLRIIFTANWIQFFSRGKGGDEARPILALLYSLSTHLLQSKNAKWELLQCEVPIHVLISVTCYFLRDWVVQRRPSRNGKRRWRVQRGIWFSWKTNPRVFSRPQKIRYDDMGDGISVQAHLKSHWSSHYRVWWFQHHIKHDLWRNYSALASRAKPHCRAVFEVSATDLRIPETPNVKWHILPTALHTFPVILMRRICLTVKSFLFGDHERKTFLIPCGT